VWAGNAIVDFPCVALKRTFADFDVAEHQISMPVTSETTFLIDTSTAATSASAVPLASASASASALPAINFAPVMSNFGNSSTVVTVGRSDIETLDKKREGDQVRTISTTKAGVSQETPAQTRVVPSSGSGKVPVMFQPAAMRKSERDRRLEGMTNLDALLGTKTWTESESKDMVCFVAHKSKIRSFLGSMCEMTTRLALLVWPRVNCGIS
jgi:hypothetical protein